MVYLLIHINLEVRLSLSTKRQKVDFDGPVDGQYPWNSQGWNDDSIL